MNNCKIVFSDIDGTLLNSNHKVTPLTKDAIHTLHQKNIPFVIVSARSPSGIYPIMNDNNFTGPIIAYSGALILNEKREIIYSTGIQRDETIRIISYAEEMHLDIHWCAYCVDEWIVKDKSSPRVKLEESIVRTQSKEKPLTDFSASAEFNKIMFICNSNEIGDIEKQMQKAFPEYSIVRSSELMLEIMKKGITKGTAVTNLCSIWHINPADSIAFGDNYNDVPMLNAVGTGYLMANAPLELKKQFTNGTLDNNHDGIYSKLLDLKLI